MKKADFILIGVVAVVVLVIVFLLYGVNSDSGKYVQVEIDGKVVSTFDLNSNETYPIVTEHGTNTLVIEDGKAKMTEADCPDKICVNHKPINKSGESIICLPHKVVIAVVNNKDNSIEIDAVA